MTTPSRSHSQKGGRLGASPMTANMNTMFNAQVNTVAEVEKKRALRDASASKDGLYNNEIPGASIDLLLLQKKPERLAFDPRSFARMMLFPSWELDVQLRTFTFANSTHFETLEFYIDWVRVEDDNAVDASATFGQCSLYSEIRNAGLSQAIIRFLLNAKDGSNGAIFPADCKIAKCPKIPSAALKPWVQGKYEKIIRMALDPNSKLAVPAPIKESLASQLKKGASHLKTDTLDPMVDSLVLYLYTVVYKEFLESTKEKHDKMEQQKAEAEAAAEATRQAEAETARLTAESAKKASDLDEFAYMGFLLSKKPASIDTKEEKKAMNKVMAIFEKDADGGKVDFTRAGFVRAMRPDSFLYRDLCRFARQKGLSIGSTVDFIEAVRDLDDNLALITPAPQNVFTAYARARTETQLTPMMARFIRKVPATDPSFVTLARYPLIPHVAPRNLPANFKKGLFNMIACFVFHRSPYCLSAGQLRVGREEELMAAFSSDNERPIQTDIFQETIDDALEWFYLNVFRDFVQEKKRGGNGGGESNGTTEFIGVGIDVLASKKGSPLLRRRASNGGFGLLSRKRSEKTANSTSNDSVSVASVEAVTSLVGGIMLYEAAEKSSSNREFVKPAKLIHTAKCFAQYMHIGSPMFTEFREFVEANFTDFECGEQEVRNFSAYLAVAELEDRIAANSAASSTQAEIYRALHWDGANQSLARFLRQTLPHDRITSLPPIPNPKLDASVKAQYVDIYNTFFAQLAPAVASVPLNVRKTTARDLEQDHQVPFNASVLDACMDHVLKHMYEVSFALFVDAKGLAA